MKICAVIPAYNEEKTVREAVRKSLQYVDEVIVVDDGSTDATASEAAKGGAVVYRHEVNLGEGAATRIGLKAALKRGADIIVTVDADGQHDPREISMLVLPVLRGEADIVIGNRMQNFTGPFTKKIGNILLTKLTSPQISDSQCGFRAMSRYAASKIKIESNGYEVASEIVFKAVLNRLRVKEVPISCIYNGANKGTGIMDGILIAGSIIKWRLRRWRRC